MQKNRYEELLQLCDNQKLVTLTSEELKQLLMLIEQAYKYDDLQRLI